ncbi:hypothetical protein L1987_07654 [Smallanthus sonchifolius]|uniref:Uncharacterized protein n=1 Tax=Smallanthus sonchifolius TaxID=185202 RepID=A0ACB9K0S1_9ASTR|nr:hypothetical protein L1987_07654 [Smallanthus sonchifolius]
MSGFKVHINPNLLDLFPYDCVFKVPSIVAFHCLTCIRSDANVRPRGGKMRTSNNGSKLLKVLLTMAAEVFRHHDVVRVFVSAYIIVLVQEFEEIGGFIGIGWYKLDDILLQSKWHLLGNQN